MKNNIISSWVVLAMSFTSLSLTACNDDNDKGSDNSDAVSKEAVMGTYFGQATIVADMAPQSTTTTEPVPVEATAGEQAIQFDKFPVDALVEVIFGEEKASEILEAIGEIRYSVDYEIHSGQAENTLSVSLNPKPLEITIPLIPTPLAESPEETIVRVQISTPQNGIFESEPETMQFSLTVESVTANDESIEMQPIELTFDLGKVGIEHH